MLDPHFHPELIEGSVFVAPTAVIVGQVSIGPESSVWYGCVLRGDINTITIGAQTNIQDGSILHVDGDQPLRIGDRVTLGHAALVHGCTVEDDVLIGIRATVLSGAHIGTGSLIGAGAVVTEGMEVPAHSLVLGVPARIRGNVSPDQAAMIRRIAQGYVQYSRVYLTTSRGLAPRIQDA